jgi:hypothetical protein
VAGTSGGGSGDGGGAIHIEEERLYFITTDHGVDSIGDEEAGKDRGDSSGDGESDWKAGHTHHVRMQPLFEI